MIHHLTLTEEFLNKMDVRWASRTLLAGSWTGEAPGKARQEELSNIFTNVTLDVLSPLLVGIIYSARANSYSHLAG